MGRRRPYRSAVYPACSRQDGCCPAGRPVFFDRSRTHSHWAEHRKRGLRSVSTGALFAASASFRCSSAHEMDKTHRALPRIRHMLLGHSTWSVCELPPPLLDFETVPTHEKVPADIRPSQTCATSFFHAKPMLRRSPNECRDDARRGATSSRRDGALGRYCLWCRSFGARLRIIPSAVPLPVVRSYPTALRPACSKRSRFRFANWHARKISLASSPGVTPTVFLEASEEA